MLGFSLHGGSLYRGLRYIVARNRVFVKWGLVIPGSSLHRGSYRSLRYMGARYTGVFATQGLVLSGFPYRTW